MIIMLFIEKESYIIISGTHLATPSEGLVATVGFDAFSGTNHSTVSPN